MIAQSGVQERGLHLPLSEEDAGTSSGEFWSTMKRRKGSHHARNDNTASQLWEKKRGDD